MVRQLAILELQLEIAYLPIKYAAAAPIAAVCDRLDDDGAV